MGKKRNKQKSSPRSASRGKSTRGARGAASAVRAAGMGPDTASTASAPAFLAPCIVLWVALALIVLLQGGFYADTAGLVGALACAAAAVVGVVRVVRARSWGLSEPGEGALASPLALAALGCTFVVALFVLVSALRMAPNITAFMAVGRYGVLLGLLACCLLVLPADRDLLLRGVCWVGVGAAALFLLLYAGVLPYSGAVEGSRLQGTFQYANACGAFMAAMGLLCVSSSDTQVHRLATLPLAAALLTQSGGALVLAGICVLAWIAVRLTRDNDGLARVALLLVQGVFALVAAALALAVASWAGVLAAAVLAAGAYVLLGSGAFAKVRQVVSAKKGRGMLAGVVVLAALAVVAAAAAFFPERVLQAQETLFERMIQMQDGAILLLANLPLGVGPDQWQFAYPFIQSAQYRAASIHSSYLQVALDGGVVAGVAWCAVVVLGLVSCARSRERGALAAVALLAGHMLIDFDMKFAAITLLFMVVAFVPTARRDAQEETGRSARLRVMQGLLVVCLAAGVVGGVASWLAGSTLGSLQQSAATGNVSEARDVFEHVAAAQNDPTCQALYLQALCDGGDYRAAADWASKHGASTDQSALYAAKALYECGKPQDAARLLVEQLAAQPGNEAFFRTAARVFETYGLPDDQKAAYDTAVERANALIAVEPACRLSTQKRIEP